MNKIHKFFATTQTSVYVVKDEKENGIPIVEKIATIKENNFPVGGRLKGGSTVGIMMKAGIVLYNPSTRGAREPELVNIVHWGGKTSSIVAIFLEKDMAIKCLNSENLVACDPRWEKETIETFKKIGNDHPVFIPSIIEGPVCCQYRE